MNPKEDFANYKKMSEDTNLDDWTRGFYKRLYAKGYSRGQQAYLDYC
jgi:hypothetical protein